jgi:hypothetical protein
VLGGPLLGSLSLPVKQVSLSLWTLDSCNRTPLGVAITSDSLCAGSNTVGVCQGGAPLVRVVSGVTTLLGVFSFTVWPGRCAATGYSAMFSRASTESASASISIGAIMMPVVCRSASDATPLGAVALRLETNEDGTSLFGLADSAAGATDTAKSCVRP